MKEVIMDEGNACRLAGNLFFPPSAGEARKPAALLIHGWRSSQESMFSVAEILANDFGIICLTVDLVGHGKSTGDREQLSRADFLSSAVAWHDFLAAREDVDPLQIGVIGSSFGGYIAAILSSERRVDWIALRAPADYPDEGFDTSPVQAYGQPGVEEWRARSRNWESTRATRALHAFPGSILIVESGKDEMVHRQTLLNYREAVKDASKLSYLILAEAPHTLRNHPELRNRFAKAIGEWYQSGWQAFTEII